MVSNDRRRVSPMSLAPTRCRLRPTKAPPFSRRSASTAQNGGVSQTSIDFGYPWWLNYGHLALFGVLLAAVLAARAAGASRWVTIPLGVLSLWAGSVALLVHLFGINSVPPLPTQTFLSSGSGRVLDLGAGTGRSSIMVLTERPQATLVASDLFGDSFTHHFGPGERPQDRLLANLKAAGVDGRATIETADMLKLPFGDDSVRRPRERVRHRPPRPRRRTNGVGGGVSRTQTARRFPPHAGGQRRVGETGLRSTAFTRRHLRRGLVARRRHEIGVRGPRRGHASRDDLLSAGQAVTPRVL